MSSQFLIQILLFAVFFSLNKSISNNVIVHFRLDDYNQIEILIDTSSENAQVYSYHSSCTSSSIQNPKFDGLIALSQSTLTINNQYAFLWNVLPKISGKFTRRNQFINELKAFGFELVNQKTAFNKQNNTECQEKAQKQLVFKAKCYDFMVSLRKIQEIKRNRIAEKQKLDEKIKHLSLKFKKIKEDNGQNIVKQFQIFDEISSLNSINRSILAQNEEVNCLLSQKFQVSNINIKHLTTYQLLYSCVEHQNVLQLSKPKMKSSKNLGRPRNIK